MALALVPRRPAQRNPRVERAIVMDLRGFADDDAHAVVDEHPPANRGPRVDLDAGPKPAPVRNPPGQPAESPAPEPVRDRPMPDERVQPGIASEDFPPALRRRVPLEHDGNVFTQTLEHGRIFPFPTVTLKYWGGPSLIKNETPTTHRRTTAASTRPAVTNANSTE